jgi:SPP1 gp7 family putative phage head morphogenesis protein
MEDDTISHQVYILRLETGQAREMVSIIDKSLPALAGAISIWLQSARKGQQIFVLQDKQFNKLQREVAKIRGGAITAAQLNYTKQLNGLVAHEIGWAEGLFRDNIPVFLPYSIPSSSKVAPRLIKNASYEGATVSQWFDTMRQADTDRIVSTVRFGVTQGLSNDDIVKSVVGTRALNHTDGVINVTRNQANRLVRTITNGMANDSRSSFAVANSELLKGERYTATLDGRTSLICISLDGTIVPVGGSPRPPQHPNCRSTMVPIVDLPGSFVDEIGERPFVRDSRTRRKRQIDFRKDAKRKAGNRWTGMTTTARNRAILREKRNWVKENIGTVPATTTYEQWLKRQPVSFQNEVLGKTRAKLWRSGNAELGDFVDRSGKVLTLEQLQKLEG